MPRNDWLTAAGILNAVAALLHLGCIAGGPPWYRFFGAGERMARMAERGAWEPAIVTLGIAAVLGLWAAYAFSGAGLLPRLPMLRTVLVGIASVYAIRAAALPVMLAAMPGRSATFLMWSSAIVAILAIVHAIGIWQGWADLAG